MLAPDFQFSQASLQDYADCPRRFQLRYVERVAWPAPQAQPLHEQERRSEQGQRFHQLVQQHLLGIPEAKLTRSAVTDPDLARWWEAYLTTRPTELPGQPYIETTLAAPLMGQRLSAKYDLIVVTPTHVHIFDWKTSARPRQPAKIDALFERLQTRVYRYLLVRAGSDLRAGLPVTPEQVSMTYWFAETPTMPLDFPYDSLQYTADERLLSAMLAEIRSRDPEIPWELTAQEKRCAFCPYRSLCERGITAGTFDPDEDVLQLTENDAFDLDFDQIAEIAF